MKHISEFVKLCQKLSFLFLGIFLPCGIIPSYTVQLLDGQEYKDENTNSKMVWPHCGVAKTWFIVDKAVQS